MIQPDATVQIFFALKTLQCRHVFKNSYFALHQKRNDFIDPSEQSVKKKKKRKKKKKIKKKRKRKRKRKRNSNTA